MSTGHISEALVEYAERKRIRAIFEDVMHDMLVALPDDPLAYLQDAFLRKTPLRLMMVGPPEAGKGVQCRIIAQKYGLQHINVLQLLHTELECGSDLSRAIAECVQSRVVVPDDIVVRLVVRAVQEAERAGTGWVLEDFPRTRAQAIYLQTHGISPQKFFFLDVTEDLARRRLVDKGAVSHDEEAPSRTAPYDWLTGIELNAESLTTRFRYFAARKDELLDCYSAFYVYIDGSQAPDDVGKEIAEQLHSMDLPLPF